WTSFVMRAQTKIHPYVEKWGAVGVALFVAIPLPGSGSYTGSVGAYMLGMSYRRFILANTLGVIIAGIAVTAITLTGLELFEFLRV
ncbi:MAG: small multi-drug export protein, partial [Pseudomonadota bacterium]